MYIALMMVGFYAMIAKNNLVKKIIGMNILQTAVILFFISTGAKTNATIPIIMHGHAGEHAHGHRCCGFNPGRCLGTGDQTIPTIPNARGR
jgi:multicomponent Na+:H+ antiporter subunit C